MNIRWLAVLLTAVPLVSAAPVRTWTPVGGGTGTDAAFVLEKDGYVGLEKPDGGKLRVPIDKLCAVDQAYLELLRNPSGSGIPPELEALFGTELADADGEPVAVESLAGKKIGIYFSASWCPPCRAFTPKLIEAYNTLQEQGEAFEIVFATSDRSAAKTTAYMQDHGMPWPALPFGCDELEALDEKYGVRGIPTLVVIDAAGKTLDRDARMDVGRDGADAFQGW